MTAGLAVLFVVLSLLAFWLSTQQSGLAIRFPIWLAGAGLLALAGFIVSQIGGNDVVTSAVISAFNNKDDPGGALFLEALSANAPAVQRYVTPLLNLLIFFAGLLAVFALVALTPGEAVERFTRPLAIGLIGATVGAGLALAMVAIAFGGPVDLDQYVGLGDADAVSDGDTFRLGDATVRLLDVDAPELNQTCRVQGAPDAPCGTLARDALKNLINGRIISCKPTENRDGRTRESFGRPLVRCDVRGQDGADFDLGARLVESGFAIPYAYDSGQPGLYEAQGALARSVKAGLLRNCWLVPDAFRNDGAARASFERGETPTGKVAGDCPA